jgi:hypothetical protein
MNSFITPPNNQMNYANLPNHSNVGMIWKYYPNLVYFGLEKLLRLYCIIFKKYLYLARTYDFLDKNINFKKNRFRILVEKSLNL